MLPAVDTEETSAGRLPASVLTPLPLIRMPVHKGRNIALIIEVADKNHILTTLGHDDQQLFLQRQEALLREPGEKVGDVAADRDVAGFVADRRVAGELRRRLAKPRLAAPGDRHAAAGGRRQKRWAYA